MSVAALRAALGDRVLVDELDDYRVGWRGWVFWRGVDRYFGDDWVGIFGFSG
jgi:hypothetical protein